MLHNTQLNPKVEGSIAAGRAGQRYTQVCSSELLLMTGSAMQMQQLGLGTTVKPSQALHIDLYLLKSLLWYPLQAVLNSKEM